jgi:zinc D-Ala-D-Ala dipeptidase
VGLQYPRSVTGSERPAPRRSAKLSVSEPTSLLRRIPICDCGEGLVDPLERCPALVWDHPRWRYRRARLVRERVAEMLAEAAAALPTGVRLAIVEGWRAPHIQRRMYLAAYNRFRAAHPDWSEAQLRRLTNRYSAPMDPRVPPPHTTGGAVDLRLIREDGSPLDVTSPYDRFDRRSFRLDAPGLSATARANRALMRACLEPAGLTNYPSEYWHWSFGDPGWAYRGGYPAALYGVIEPDGWAPDPEDDGDGPLEPWQP